MNLRLQEQRIEWLKAATKAAFDGESSPNPVFTALKLLAERFRIPSHYAEELIEGMSMDVRKERYETMDELGLYCYRVAGTVGLMMVHVMGVSDERALRHAAALGSAMQLTNISRDVIEDAAMDRVYLPLSWLDEAGVPEGQVTQGKYREAVFSVVERLLVEADRYYREGRAGLKYLPWRAALACAVASCVYSAIGRKVLRRGPAAWDSRTVVSKPRKLLAVLEGLWLVATTLPYRIVRPWKRAPVELIWRHQT
jgi:phytoene synthase